MLHIPVIPPPYTRQVNWAQSFNARGWPEKILVGANVQPASAPTDNNVLFSLFYPPRTSDPNFVPGYENNGNIKEMWQSGDSEKSDRA